MNKNHSSGYKALRIPPTPSTHRMQISASKTTEKRELISVSLSRISFYRQKAGRTMQKINFKKCGNIADAIE